MQESRKKKMKTIKTTVTKEYDADGKLIKEIQLTETIEKSDFTPYQPQPLKPTWKYPFIWEIT